MTTTANDFDAAKAIVEQLKDMEKERQQRILRWVAESLDLTLHVKIAGTHDTHDSHAAVGPAPVHAADTSAQGVSASAR